MNQLATAVDDGVGKSDCDLESLALSTGSQDFADSAKSVALLFVHGQEFKAMAQAIAIADQSANLGRMCHHGQRQLQRNDLSDFQLASERRPHAVESQLAGPAPEGKTAAFTQNVYVNADIQRESHVSALVRAGRTWFRPSAIHDFLRPPKLSCYLTIQP
jgi:hypothetical protein